MPEMADYGDMQPPPKPKIDKWDQRFINLARLVSSWSKDPRKKVGAVITNPNRSVASLGYNGFARGMLRLRRRVALLLSSVNLHVEVLHCSRAVAHIQRHSKPARVGVTMH